MYKQVNVMAMILMVVAFGARIAPAGADTGLSESDRDFVSKAAEGGLMEVAAGKLAAKRALDPAVKAFGQQMITDHTAANQRLKSLADSKQLPLPSSMSEDHQKVLGKLETLVGADFDKTYAQMMVKDHMEDIDEFEKEIKKGQDPDVKSFAHSVLPTLQHHLQMANQLKSQHKKGAQG